MPKHDHLRPLPKIDRRIDKEEWGALNFAAYKHEHQIRKVDKEPYIKHPHEVGELIRTHGGSRVAIIAGYLHDTVEDTDTTFEELETKFGRDVALTVLGVTKNSDIPEWEDRNEAYRQVLETHGSDDAVWVALADKISNLRDIIKHWESQGDALWHNGYFKRGPRANRDWFQSIYDLAERRIPDCPLLEILGLAIAQFNEKLAVYEQTAKARTDMAAVAIADVQVA